MFVLRYAGFWLILLALAFLNATIRELLYKDAVGERRSQQLSTMTMAAIVVAFAWFVVSRWPLARFRDAVAVGILWSVSTAAFEAFMMVVLAGRPLSVAAAPYNLADGNLWSLLLLVILFAPPIAWKLCRRLPPVALTCTASDGRR
jgi:hypothetical protein